VTAGNIESLKPILAARGAEMADFVKIMVCVTDISRFDKVGEARMCHFLADGPASAITEVRQLAHFWL
jgi:enamine deaminase RidA (YjgF/YER057c/UK114 family)